MNRRKFYRVPTASHPIQVVAVSRDGSMVHCHVDDVNAKGARLRCPTDSRRLPLGEPFELRFMADGVDVSIDAEVVHEITDTRRPCYGVRFIESLDLDDQLGPAMRKLFNRRAHRRFRLVHRSP